MRSAAVAVSILALTSCSTVHNIDRNSMTDFQMTGAATWAMTVTTAANYPPDSEAAEAIRTKWITQHTAANGCSNPVIETRQFTKAMKSLARTGASDSVGKIAYTGTCSR